MPVYGALGFAGVSESFKSHESAAFLESKGPIFQVPLNPTYEVKSVLCRDLSIRGTSALRFEETLSVRVMFNRTHVIYRHSTPLECGCLNIPFSIDIPPLWGEEALQNLIETFKTR